MNLVIFVQKERKYIFGVSSETMQTVPTFEPWTTEPRGRHANHWPKCCLSNHIYEPEPDCVTLAERGGRWRPRALLTGGEVTWHAGCRGKSRVSLVKWRSCRTGWSCTAETGICTVPGGAVRNTCGTDAVIGEQEGEEDPSVVALASNQC